MAALTGGLTIYPDAAEKVTNTPECESLLVSVCKDALNAAYAAAPEHRGDYRASLFASAKTGEDKPTAILGSSSWHWHWVEYGSINQSPSHTIGEAVASVVQVYVET